MIRSPGSLPAEGPAFHEPDSLGIALLQSLHQTMRARSEVFGLPGLGQHLHEEITIVQVRDSAIQLSVIKKAEWIV